MRGLLIVFEGLDRSGKSTQSELLRKELNSAKLLKFPDRTTEIGKLINKFLVNPNSQCFSSEMIHLLFSANRWELRDEILKLLQAGITVILDRYAYSGVAYSSGVLGLDFDWCVGPESGLPKPDVVFYIHVPTETIVKRSGFGAEFYEKLESQEKVAHVFNKLSRMEAETWVVIDGSSSIDEIHHTVMTKVTALLTGLSADSELGTLWVNSKVVNHSIDLRP